MLATGLMPADDVDGDSEALPLLVWVEKHRRILNRATGLAGPFSLSDYPWMQEIYAAETFTEPVPRSVIQKGAQLGVSEYSVSLALWAMDVKRLTVFYALPPGGTTVNDFSHQRISPAITDTPHLMARGLAVDNVTHKQFYGGGAIFIRGTNIPLRDPRRAQQLASVPADIAIIDEFDRVPPAAIPLIRSRTQDSRFPMERLLSTPTVPAYGIHAEYLETDQREPHVKCAACQQWRRLDWSLIQEPGVMVCRCGAEVNMTERWQVYDHSGQPAVRYIAQVPTNTVVGYWIPALVSHRANLKAMWQRAHSSDEEEVQAFWNNDLGLPYEPKGAKLTETMLEACRREYTFPDFDKGGAAMGVDVQGADLHVYIKRQVEGGKERALWIGTVPEFADLEPLMQRYEVHCCVVDAMPEIRGAQGFAEKYRGRVYLARFVERIDGNEMAVFHHDTQAVRVDRTKAILASHAGIEQQRDELPQDYKFISGFVEQMTALTRIRAETAQGQIVYKFLKTGRPDHYDLAKAYCEVAMQRVQTLGAPFASVAQPEQASRWKRSVPAVPGDASFDETGGGGGSRWKKGYSR